jgi:eukaryotic-like serine/threonine-protein kinase
MNPERCKQIERVYHAALERNAAERPCYVKQACAGDDALRQEVESLLAQEQPTDKILGNWAPKLAANMTANLHEGNDGQSLIGKQIGSYQILGLLGAGGMGEVYRARDTRLNRFVALKILPKHLADNPAVRERFEREAKTIASLNHAHICVLHDVGHQDGMHFLVMEYLEGETLAERLKKGALPLEQTLQYAIEISDALDKAHCKGITHRDLKPGNIMLTTSGAKLLDFGLAKLQQQANPGISFSQAATAKGAITAEGTILGTLQYMAPEQLEGKEADARTDIFAFGAVVYEMATGKKAFEGTSHASLIAKILEADPPSISSLQPMTPPQLDHVVKKCLAKEPDRRWQAASDVCDELKWISGTAAEVTKTTLQQEATFAPRKLPLRVVGLIAAAVAVVTGFLVWHVKPRTAQPTQVSRFSIILPAGERLAALDNRVLALSPDGTYLAYAAVRGVTQQLYLRRIDSLEATPIPGTDGAIAPFFSPDGQQVGFFAQGKLQKVAISGGSPQTLATTLNSFNAAAAWGADGTIVGSSVVGSGVWQVSDQGGTAKPVATVYSELAESFPAFLPGGRQIVFTGLSGNPNSIVASQIVLQALGSSQRKNLIAGASPAYAPTGHLIFAQQGTLMAVPFDLGKLEVTGSPVPLVEGVAQSLPSGLAEYSISRNGVLAYVPGIALDNERLVWVGRQGGEQFLPAPPSIYGYPRLSPDGRRVAVGRNGQIWIFDIVRETLTRLTFGSGTAVNPLWSTDGKRVVFQFADQGPLNLFWQPADGSGPAERLSTSKWRQAASSVSADGQLLAFTETNPTTGSDIWVLRLSDRSMQPFLRTPASEGGAQFSPDGHWIAYSSNESGRNEVYVQPYPGPGGKWQISADGGAEPLWNPNGRELFYRNGRKMMAVDVVTQPTFTPANPKVLFEGSYRPTNVALPYYAVTRDAQRFLMVKANEAEQPSTQINVVVNWFEELKRRVPTGK